MYLTVNNNDNNIYSINLRRTLQCKSSKYINKYGNPTKGGVCTCVEIGNKNFIQKHSHILTCNTIKDYIKCV